MREQYRQPGTQYRQHSEGFGNGGSDRGWWDRASDEVSSWFGDERAETRREMDDRSGYRRDHRERDPVGRGRVGARFGNSRGRRGESAADVMSTDVVRVHPEDSLQHAARMMAGYDCGALPVVDRNNRLIGMITDRDIAVRGVAETPDAGRMPVGAVMTDEAFACHVHDSLRDCMHVMAEHQVRRIPIVDDRHHVVGIVSQADVARHADARRAVAEVVREVSEPTDDPYRD